MIYLFMKSKVRSISLLLVIFLVLASSAAEGLTQTSIMDSCSIFTVSIGDKVYFGNNEDYLLDGTYLWLVPTQDYEIANETLSLPGAMLLGFDHNTPPDPGDGRMQGGMNEYGLCWDGNGLPAVSMNQNSDGEQIWYPEVWVWMQVLLECRNISDVIQWFDTYDLGDAWAGQGHYCDADGNALVVSVNSTGDLTFTMIGEANFLVSTNFNLAWPENRYEPYPCPRYATVINMLADITTEENLTPEACQAILEEVSTTQTSYSNVFDPVNQEMYLNIYQDFEHTKILNLHEELSKVTPDAEDTLTDKIYYYQQVLLAGLFVNSIPGYSSLIIIGSTLVAVGSLVMVFWRKKNQYIF